MAASRRVRTESGAAEPRTDMRARSASSWGVKLVHVAGDLVLLNQAAAEEQRIIGPERDRHAGLEQGADRDRGRIGRDPERRH